VPITATVGVGLSASMGCSCWYRCWGL